MDDDKIREMFAGFDPELSDASDFMARVTRGLDAVEIVREHQAEVRRRQKRALGVAACIGVLVGVGLTMLYMIVADSITAFYLPDMTWIVRSFGLSYDGGEMAVDLRMPTLLFFAAAALLTALNAYSISMAGMERGLTLRERSGTES